MKNSLYAFLFLATFSLFFSSCKSEVVEEISPVVEANPDFRILVPQGNDILFVASPKQWYATDCLSAFATCRWIILEEVCEAYFPSTVDDGIIYINQEETPDVLFTIETYGQNDVVGFRFKGFSDEFLAASAANGDDGSTFTVEDNYNLKEESVGLLGYQSIQLQEGQYDIITDPNTNEKVVYIAAVLE